MHGNRRLSMPVHSHRATKGYSTPYAGPVRHAGRCLHILRVAGGGSHGGPSYPPPFPLMMWDHPMLHMPLPELLC